MYYTRITNDEDGEPQEDENPNVLKYYCQQCGHEEFVTDTFTRVLVTDVNSSASTQVFSRYINKYTKLDPTLPRISTINCPNVVCASNSHDDRALGEEETKTGSEPATATAAAATSAKRPEVIYIRYDNVNMKYVYLCVHCDHIWTNEV